MADKNLPADLMNEGFYDGVLPQHPDPVLLPNKRIEFDINQCPQKTYRRALLWLGAMPLVFIFLSIGVLAAIPLGVFVYMGTALTGLAAATYCARKFTTTLEKSGMIKSYRWALGLPLQGDLNADTQKRFCRNQKTGRIAKPVRIDAAARRMWQAAHADKAGRKRHLQLALRDMGRFLGR